MFYLTSKFHGNRVSTVGFMEGEGGLLKGPPGPGTPKKPRRNRVKVVRNSFPFSIPTELYERLTCL